MTDMTQHHCTRPWYMRPPVWVLGLVAAGLIIFGIVEVVGSPPATSYGNFLAQLDAGNVASVTFQGTRIDGRFKHPVPPPRRTANNKARSPAAPPISAIPPCCRSCAKSMSPSTWWPPLTGRRGWDGCPGRWWCSSRFILIAGFVRFVRGRNAPAAGGGMPMQPPMMRLFSGLFGKQDQPTAGGDKNG